MADMGASPTGAGASMTATPLGRAIWRETIMLVISGYMVFNMNRGKLSAGKIPLHIRWLAGLTVFDQPSIGELQKFAAAEDDGRSKGKGSTKPRLGAGAVDKRKKKGASTTSDSKLRNSKTDQTKDFTIPNTAAIVLPVRPLDFQDIDGTFFEWNLELLTCLITGTLGVFAFTEAAGHFGYSPPASFSALLTWSGCTALYSAVVAADIVRMRAFDTDGLLCVFIGFGGFAMATLVLVFLEDDAVDFGIAAGQVDFAQSMRTFCTLLHIAPFAPSLGAVKLLLAVVAGVVTTLLFFPQLSIAKSSITGARRYVGQPLNRLLLFVVDGVPALIVLGFLPAVLRHPFVSSTGLSNQVFTTGRVWLLLGYGAARLVAFRSQVQCHYWQTEDAMLKQQMADKPYRVKASAILQHVNYVKASASAVAVRLLVGTSFVLSTTIVYKLKSESLASGVPSGMLAADADARSLLGLFMVSPTVYTALTSFFLWWAAIVSLVVRVIAPAALQ